MKLKKPARISRTKAAGKIAGEMKSLGKIKRNPIGNLGAHAYRVGEAPRKPRKGY